MIGSAMWMVGTLVSFVGMAIAGRELSSTLGTFQILFFRSLIGLILLSIGLQERPIRTPQFGLHVARMTCSSSPTRCTSTSCSMVAST